MEIAKVIAPIATAFLAALLALMINRYLDSRKARREMASSLSDEFRDDVRAAVEAASGYWSDPTKDKLLTEARIKMLEQELRAAAVLIDDGKNDRSPEFQGAVNSFLAVLTGADFESKVVAVNHVHIRDVVGRGVALRKATAQLRKSSLGK